MHSIGIDLSLSYYLNTLKIRCAQGENKDRNQERTVEAQGPLCLYIFSLSKQYYEFPVKAILIISVSISKIYCEDETEDTYFFTDFKDVKYKIKAQVHLVP